MPYHKENPWPLSPPKSEGFGYYAPFPFPAIMTEPFPMKHAEPESTTEYRIYAERIFNVFVTRLADTEKGADYVRRFVWKAQSGFTMEQWTLLARILTEAGLPYEVFVKNLGINPDPRCASRKKGAV